MVAVCEKRQEVPSEVKEVSARIRAALKGLAGLLAALPLLPLMVPGSRDDEPTARSTHEPRR